MAISSSPISAPNLPQAPSAGHEETGDIRPPEPAHVRPSGEPAPIHQSNAGRASFAHALTAQPPAGRNSPVPAAEPPHHENTQQAALRILENQLSTLKTRKRLILGCSVVGGFTALGVFGVAVNIATNEASALNICFSAIGFIAMVAVPIAALYFMPNQEIRRTQQQIDQRRNEGMELGNMT